MGQQQKQRHQQQQNQYLPCKPHVYLFFLLPLHKLLQATKS